MDTDIGQQVVFFSLFLLLFFFGLLSLFFLNYWLSHREDGKTPYGTLPLRRGSEVPLLTRVYVRKFLNSKGQYDNQPIDMDRAAVCRETGRIFFECADFFGHVSVGWDFIRKRYPGSYVSYGSLSEEQKQAIRIRHGSLEGFQTEFSSKNPAPSQVEARYAFASPGPLYVDPETEVLVGWQKVPSTDLEVLIVKHPLPMYQTKKDL